LTTAHTAGIVHRDLKPGNIMVTGPESGRPGLVKVLDFGLAKLTEKPERDEAATQTLGQDVRTEEGVVLGTVAYMSPEQAEGKKVDARSDIFSFGSVLYEMVTGQRPFGGDSKLSTLSAILRDEPKLPGQMGEPIPRDLEKIILRCLRKDPERRFQHMADLLVALQELKEETDSGVALETAAPAARQAKQPAWPAAVAAVAGLAVVAAGVSWWVQSRSQRRSPPAVRRLTVGGGINGQPAISPDGKLVVFSSDRAGGANTDLWLQQVAGGEAVRLTQLAFSEGEPAFSPDGSRIVFCGHGLEDGLYVISTLGGEPRKLVEGGHGGQFSPDGAWIAYWALEGTKPRIYVIPAAGGAPRRLAADFDAAAYPIWSSDGRAILFEGAREAQGTRYERFDWWITPLEGGSHVRTNAYAALRQQKVLSGGGDRREGEPAAWVGGRVLFTARAGGDSLNLWDIAVESRTGRVSGPARQLTSGAGREEHPSVATDGTLAFSVDSTNFEYWSLPMETSAFKATGELRQATRNSGGEYFVLVSRDGRLIGYCSGQPGKFDVILRDLESGRETAVVASPAVEHLSGLSADASRVLYFVVADGKASYFLMPVRGGAPARVCEACGPGSSLSSDGTKVIYRAPTSSQDLMLFEATSGRTQSLTGSKALQESLRDGPVFSPDDRFIAAVQAIAGTSRTKLVLVPFGDGKLDVAGAISITDGSSSATSPTWSPDGRVLYFLSNRDRNNCLYAQRLDPQTRRPVGEPVGVYHFHAPNQPLRAFAIAAAVDKVVISIMESSSSVWLTKMPE
jgi:Tol biopolymer transport system component